MALSKKTKFVSGGILIAAAVIAAIVINRPEASASSQSTDDAYIRADITSVAPQVAGLITHVLVEENETVKAGQLLARIDDRDYELAVRSAKATLASAQASADALKAQATVQQSVIHQASATLNADQANLKLARADFNRYSSLAADGSGTIQARQQAQARLRVQEAQHEKNRAIHQAETERLTILQADLQRAAAAVEQAKAAVGQAELNLSYTYIVAPISGVIGHKNLRVGNFAKIGEALITVVPLADIYVEANFRETQLAKMHAGQPVTLTVDALPGQTFSGKVQSVGPASGVSYSTIAPHNATGNFTKIVQRLPVRIALDPHQENTSLLRVGMSVQPEVDVSGSNSGS